MQTKNLLLLAALTTGASLGSMALAPSAQAITWTWTYTQTNFAGLDAGNGSGTLTTNDTPDSFGKFLVTSIADNFGNLGGPIALLPVGSFPGGTTNNNQLPISGTLTTGDRIGFSVGGTEYLITNFGVFQDGGFFSQGNFSATPVPLESDALPIVGSVVFMAGGLWFKRRRAQAKANLEFLNNDTAKSA
jgi:hypothetical protein